MQTPVGTSAIFRPFLPRVQSCHQRQLEAVQCGARNYVSAPHFALDHTQAQTSLVGRFWAGGWVGLMVLFLTRTVSGCPKLARSAEQAAPLTDVGPGQSRRCGPKNGGIVREALWAPLPSGMPMDGTFLNHEPFLGSIDIQHRHTLMSLSSSRPSFFSFVFVPNIFTPFSLVFWMVVFPSYTPFCCLLCCCTNPQLRFSVWHVCLALLMWKMTKTVRGKLGSGGQKGSTLLTGVNGHG
ncbi:hypothetical protein B0J18DRAFT_206669 [Chaetomium sp. MPI-SDFR-AT-0129]|nr:hypothetical protein B0J18DRAFT_206669 [Chaetomium sp. MPI-SDFR-AT-0129]